MRSEYFKNLEDENEQLRKTVRRYRAWTRIETVFTVLVLVSALILFTRVYPLHLDSLSQGSDRTVHMGQSDLQFLNDSYRPDLEQGYCLYGFIEDENAVILETVKAEPSSQGRNHVSFSCLGETRERLSSLVLNSDYGFIGALHTHPPESSHRLSLADARTLGAAWFALDIKGIYDGERIAFYSVDRPGYGMKLEVHPD